MHICCIEKIQRKTYGSVPRRRRPIIFIHSPLYYKKWKILRYLCLLSTTGLYQFRQKVVFSLQSELKFLWPCCKVPGPNNPEAGDTGEDKRAPLKQGPLYSWKVWDSCSELCSLQFPSNLSFMSWVLLCFPVIFMQGKAKFCPFCH